MVRFSETTSVHVSYAHKPNGPVNDTFPPNNTRTNRINWELVSSTTVSCTQPLWNQRVSGKASTLCLLLRTIPRSLSVYFLKRSHRNLFISLMSSVPAKNTPQTIGHATHERNVSTTSKRVIGVKTGINELSRN